MTVLKEWVVPLGGDGKIGLQIVTERGMPPVVMLKLDEQQPKAMTSLETAQLLISLQEAARDVGAEVGKAAMRRRRK